MKDSVRARLEALATEFALPPEAPERLGQLLAAVAAEPSAITSVKDPAQAVDVHVADSLSALVLPQVRAARAIADIGSGAGFPGIPLALALPEATVQLVESTKRKCAFLERAAALAGLANVAVAHSRAEQWTAGAGACDLVTARALAELPVLVEYAAPLLMTGGALVAWKGRVGAAEHADGEAAAAVLGLRALDPVPTTPYSGAREHTLYVYLKVGSTPNEYPRRPGIARKRPLRASTSA